MVKFTRKGERAVNCFIQDCIAKRKKILDEEKDEVGDVLLPSKEENFEILHFSDVMTVK